ncbi:ArnT family glycosyltransferase [Salinisphaera sp.]|uniref:ArnT family glycosyltransferase n=1 Tax=Salinisphaera sp. TaxID=1914330 RepID=UPI002D7957F4|nr:glycosyltransferase family 39 protein [Salinisphaera sp.]HET7315662.1 glycosyltransferase family 39 protein [Salinisphaera sp.]
MRLLETIRDRPGLDRAAGAALAVLALLVVVVFSQVHTGYAFFYSDAPRRALNGAFILDLVKAFPIHDPVQWAYDYYAQYPALTILFYPPLYPAVLAVAYAVLGISQTSAVVVNGLFYLGLVWGMYRLAGRYLDRGAALGAAAIVGAAPEIAFWGRQIMTDVPATAALVWASAVFVDYLRNRRARDLYWSAALALAAVWLKLTVCFMLPVFAVALLLAEGRWIWRSARHWIVLTGVVVGLLPLAWLTLHFGQTNVQSVAGVPDGAVGRLSVANWLWYAKRAPEMLGWPTTVALALGLAAGLLAWAGPGRVDRRWLLPIAWAVVGYVFFSAIDLKHPRFMIPVLPPFVLIGVGGLRWLLRRWRNPFRIVLACIAAATLAITLVVHPPLYVGGYASIVKAVAQRAPKKTNIVFSGYRDGAFIFAMRAIGDRPDLATIRADKLLLSIAIRRSAGVEQKDLTADEIARELTRLKVSYVVAQDGFWTDLVEMRRLQKVLHSSQFEPVAHYRLPRNFQAPDREITVYRNRAELPKKRPPRAIDLPAINHTVKQN